MSEAARRYVAQRHTLQGAARGYLEFLVSLRGTGESVRVSTLAARKPPGTLRATDPTLPAAIPQPAPPSDHSSPQKETGDPVAILAEAAAELGITEKDDSTLRNLANALDGLV